MDWKPEFDWVVFGSHAIHLLMAFVLTLPVAWERERATRSLGLRTFPLSAVASCGFILVAVSIAPDSADAHSRVVAGLMTAMGFIGGGAILRRKSGVSGTATAASLWTCGVLGAAVGYGLYELAVLISAINFLTFKILTPVEKKRYERAAASPAAKNSELTDD